VCNPSAIARQNRRRISRRIVGPPNDPNFGRNPDFTHLVATSINTFHDQVLRRLFELRHGGEVGVVIAANQGAVVGTRLSAGSVLLDVMRLRVQRSAVAEWEAATQIARHQRQALLFGEDAVRARIGLDALGLGQQDGDDAGFVAGAVTGPAPGFVGGDRVAVSGGGQASSGRVRLGVEMQQDRGRYACGLG
jgi:hypothetical protein